MSDNEPRGVWIALGIAAILIAIVVILLSQGWRVQSASDLEQPGTGFANLVVGEPVDSARALHRFRTE